MERLLTIQILTSRNWSPKRAQRSIIGLYTCLRFYWRCGGHVSRVWGWVITARWQELVRSTDLFKNSRCSFSTTAKNVRSISCVVHYSNTARCDELCPASNAWVRNDLGVAFELKMSFKSLGVFICPRETSSVCSEQSKLWAIFGCEYIGTRMIAKHIYGKNWPYHP